jgi:hypothetical protein
MSMPNDHQMPKVPEESAEGIVCCSWDELTSLLDTDNQEAFASWLDDQLAELESDLDEYVSDRSRYQGRRS